MFWIACERLKKVSDIMDMKCFLILELLQLIKDVIKKLCKKCTKIFKKNMFKPSKTACTRNKNKTYTGNKH